MFSNVFTFQVFSPLISLMLFFVAICLFSIIGLPLSNIIFNKWKDKGYIFSRLIGIIIVTYIVWLGASFKLLPFNQLFLWIVTLALLIVSFRYLFRKNAFCLSELYKNRSIIIFEESLFWSFFIIFLVIRYLNPDLWHPYMGGEKPMDFAILNSIVRGQSIPPLDPWFAGATLNYYYYSHYILGAIVKLINIIPAIAYNLFIPFLFAQTAVSIFSIVYNFTHSKKISLLGSAMVVVAGNLAQLPFIIKSFATLPPINSWYWNATRIMPNNEISEFPFFSFLYADLHSHLNSLPLAILVIAVSLSFISTIKVVSKTKYIIRIILMSLFIGVLRASNTWDYPSYMVFFGLTLFISIIINQKINFISLIRISLVFVVVLIFSNILILPFLDNFHTGKLVVTLYQGAKTTIKNYLIIHGLFLYVLASFCFVCFIFREKLFQYRPKIIIILLMYITAILFTLIPDIIDFPIGLGRMNTVFKFYFQAWIFFAIASAISFSIITSFLRQKKPIYFVWLSIFLLLFSFTLLYPITATPAKIRDRMNSVTPPTLNGMEYMKDSTYSDNGHALTLLWDYQAINWLNSNIDGSPTIIEAVSSDYRWGSRISDYTGLPTILGWEYHEVVYRSYLTNNEVSTRAKEVALFYNTLSHDVLSSLIQKYNISYICVGELEKAYYDEKGLAKFTTLVGSKLRIVYQNKGIIIYQVIKPAS